MSVCVHRTKSAFSLRQLTFSQGTLTSSTKAGAGFLGRGNTVERVVILGVKAAPASIVAKTSGGVVSAVQAGPGFSLPRWRLVCVTEACVCH